MSKEEMKPKKPESATPDQMERLIAEVHKIESTLGCFGFFVIVAMAVGWFLGAAN